MPQKTKQVGKYTVFQMAPLEEARARIYNKRFVESKSDDPDEREAHKIAYEEWAYVAACIMPYIPFDEYRQTPTLELQELREAVAEVNDDMAQLGEKLTEAQAKKKKSSRPVKSTSG